MDQRERVLDEATVQFFRLGIRNVRMDDIAAALGMSKRTLYEMFRDKTELVQSVLMTLSGRQRERHQEMIASRGNVIDTIFGFMHEGIRLLGSINPVFYSDLKKFYPSVWNALHKAKVQSANEISHHLLQRGIDEGVFRKDISIPIVSRLFHEQMNLISDEKVFPREEFDFAEVFRNLTINFMRGISTPKGIDMIDSILENKENSY